MAPARVPQARLAQRLMVQADVAPDLLRLPVPPMILQPLVENAIIHGISPIPAGGQLQLLAEIDGDRLQLSVRNSGSPVSDTEHDWEERGTALRNIRARLQALYGGAATFRVTAPAQGGFVASLEIPVAAGS